MKPSKLYIFSSFVITLMTIFPPRAIYGQNGSVIPTGYSFLFVRETFNPAMINLHQLIGQILFVVSLTIFLKLAGNAYQQAMKKVTP